MKVKTVVKLAALSGVALAGLAAAAYKNWIPGGPELVDAYQALKNRVRFLQFQLDRTRTPAGTVVFLGSSSIGAFPLHVYFPGAPWLNRGLGADTLVDLLQRLDGTLPVARPASVVIFAGMNDLRSEAADPEVIAARMDGVIDAITGRFPGVAMAIIEITPYCDQTESDLRRLHALNHLLRQVAQAKGVAFVSTNRPPLTDSGGCLEAAMAGADRKHMNLAGYGLLAKWLVEDGGAAAAPLVPASRP